MVIAMSEDSGQQPPDVAADMVQVEVAWDSGLLVSITNWSEHTIGRVKILSVEPGDEDPMPWSAWEPNGNMIPAPATEWHAIGPRDKVEAALWLFTRGTRIVSPPTVANVTVQFRDWTGKWWHQSPDGATSVPEQS
jgi:hypothetical protein